MPLVKSQARNVGKQLQIKQELLLQLMNFYYVYVSLWDRMLCVKGNLMKWYQFSLIETRFFPGFGYARFLGISSFSPKNPTPALQAIIRGLKKYSFCNPYDLFTICAIGRSVDYKQVLLCFVLETGIQRTLTSNPDQSHGSIPIGSWESSCSSEKHLNSCEADVDRVWDEGEGTRGGWMGELPKENTGILFFSLL